MKFRSHRESLAMNGRKLRHIDRRLTEEERARHEAIRASALQDIPPKQGVGQPPSPPGIATRIRETRESQGLTWYALAKRASISDQAVIRDIEQGRDIKLSDLEAIAAALGLRLELVEQIA
jgi:ribosome-binding protein aMBF1 (putative translation factor)